MRRRRLLGCAVLMLVVGGLPGRAGQLPVRRYSTDQGLPHDAVSRVVEDSHGFLWVATAGGLARFDGHEFEVYTAAHGLPVSSANGIVENPDGTYWVSSWWNGISRFDPEAGDPTRLFTPVALESEPNAKAQSLHRGRDGTIWIGATTGLWRLDTTGATPTIARVELHSSSPLTRIPRVWDLTDDRHGNLWMATTGGLAVRSPTGVVSYRPVVGERNVECYSVLEGRDGAIWAGHDEGVTILDPAGTIRAFSSADGIGDGLISSLMQTADGKVWLAPVKGGLTEFDGERFRHLAPGDELGPFLPKYLAEDSRGNIWIGSLDRGLVRLARTGVTAFAETEGLSFGSYASIALDRSGNVILTAGSEVFRMHRDEVTRVSPPFLAGHTSGRSGQNSALLIDRGGGWWFGTAHGLYRYPALARFEDLSTRDPIRVDLADAGFATVAVSALFEDAGGDIWIGLGAAGEVALWKTPTGRLLRLKADRGALASAAIVFEQDTRGDLWLGGSAGVTRYRDGRFEALYPFSVYDLHVDDEGRLWIATLDEGLVRVDQPWLDNPPFTRYDRDSGLAADYARGVVEDRFGRLYVGTNAGISRLDPDSGRIELFDTNHGLSNDEIHAALRDPDGALWFTSRRGVSRIEPRSAISDDPVPPEVRVTAVRVAGRPTPISALGQPRVTGLRLAAGDDSVAIEFGSIAFDLGREVRYQYKLDGAESGWTAPAPLRSVHYARLAPGDYRFAVRAVNARGVTSESEASVDFRVLRPFWQQGWFAAIVVGLIAAGAYLIHRYRLGRMLEMERVRMRIATDLHDDLGSSLSRIAILSEVLQRRSGRDDPALVQSLARIASVSRELVDSMGDIVWAINPRRDHIRDLVQRMRRFAGDTLSAKEIDLVLNAPADVELRLGPDVRRQIYLVFKESVHNAVRHAGCSRVEIDLEVRPGALSLRVADDGRGFEPDDDGHGHGLESMRRRAAEMGGQLEIQSNAGSGTVVWLSIPL